MAELKKATSSKILWLDMEMTGLDPSKDRIVEVAAVVTDWRFAELASFESGVRQTPQSLARFKENDWAMARQENTQALINLSLSSPAEDVVEAEVLKLADAHFGANELVLLAGNSIHQDRQFIRHWWPKLEARLHYRMLDVSAWKVVMQGKFKQEFTKKEAHRAFDDIRESIAELQYYVQWFEK